MYFFFLLPSLWLQSSASTEDQAPAWENALWIGLLFNCQTAIDWNQRKKMIILTAFDMSLAPKLFLFKVFYVYQTLGEAYGNFLMRYPLLVWNGNLCGLSQVSCSSAHVSLSVTNSLLYQHMQTGLRLPCLLCTPTFIILKCAESLTNNWLLPKLKLLQLKLLSTRKCQRQTK